MTVDERVAALNAKGYSVWLHQRDDRLWQCTLHLFNESPLFFSVHVAELHTAMAEAEASMDKKIATEGWPKKLAPKVKGQSFSSTEAEALLKELGIS